MAENNDFRSMAETREEEAAQLSDTEIYATIVANVMNQDMPFEFSWNMLKEAIGDDELIRNAVNHAEKLGTISNELAEKCRNEI